LDSYDVLLGVTAFAASVALSGVSEAFGVHEINQHLVSRIQQVDISPATLPDVSAPAAGVLPASVDPSLIPQLTGRALLDQLSGLSGDLVSEFMQQNPKTVANLLANPPSARDVSVWWTTRSSTQQRTLLHDAPAVVGNLNGVPFAVRDQANRTYLSQSLAGLKKQLASTPGRAASAELRARIHTLEQIDKALAGTRSDPHRTLVTVDTSYPGRAAIITGDLDTADYVTYLVPGMFFTIDGQVGDWADTATQLYKDQTAWLKHFAATDPQARNKSVATVAWIGYETPHLLTVGNLDLANQGADYLTRAIEGLQELRGSRQPFVTVIAHSYGSTAAMIALQQHTFQIDALAVVGSPGSAAQSVSELSVRGGNVFVGEAAWDPVVNTAFYGSDPGAPSYGAHPMGVNGGIDPITHKQLRASYGHNEYFVPGSESLRTMALIGIDEGAYVSQ
jgi:hypothetical protein